MNRPGLLSLPAVRRLAYAAPVAAGLALTAVVIPAGMASAAPTALPANCTQSGQIVTCTFAFTGAAQSWTAPAGVATATVTLDGAQGGNAPGPLLFSSKVVPPGAPTAVTSSELTPAGTVNA